MTPSSTPGRPTPALVAAIVAARSLRATGETHEPRPVVGQHWPVGQDSALVVALSPVPVVLIDPKGGPQRSAVTPSDIAGVLGRNRQA